MGHRIFLSKLVHLTMPQYHPLYRCLMTGIFISTLFSSSLAWGHPGHSDLAHSDHSTFHLIEGAWHSLIAIPAILTVIASSVMASRSPSQTTYGLLLCLTVVSSLLICSFHLHSEWPTVATIAYLAGAMMSSSLQFIALSTSLRLLQGLGRKSYAQ